MFDMLKKLASGEYSLKVTFWLFGLCGMFVFQLLANMTHNGVLRTICSSGGVCVKSVILYIFFNFPLLLTGGGRVGLSAFVPHLLVSSLFVSYMLILLSGLWKSSAAYEGNKFWVITAKIIVVFLVFLGLKVII